MISTRGSIVDVHNLPDKYPTHRHEAEFWEWLGRTVATFGYLEHVLARAIFALSATREYTEEGVQEALKKWLPKLERSLADTLDPLIRAYEQEVKSYQSQPPEDFDDLIRDLKKAAEIRNVLCHGFWNAPNAQGATVPLFMRAKDKQLFDTEVDVKFLQQMQRAAAELAMDVVNTITKKGLQFPGSSGPGKTIA
ncbi:MAG: hypothetical protein K0M49_01525 [Arenimonas sp.]|nr:hypothetical protein [Arenimonas sp.]